MKKFKNLFFLITFILYCHSASSQIIRLDTTFHKNKIWKIEAFKDNKRFGLSKTYKAYLEKPSLDYYWFYLNDKLFGLSVRFDLDGSITEITNYRNDKRIYSKSIYFGNVFSEEFFSALNAKIKYGKVNIIQSIIYPELKEEVVFYPNMTVKSIIVTDSSKKVLERKYYEFSELGMLKIEGTYADSFVQTLDTIVTFDPETFEEIWQVIVDEIPLKNGDWFYYNEKGILQEKKTFNYYTERKSTFVKTTKD